MNISHVKGTGYTLGRFSAIFSKGDNCYVFLMAFLHIKFPSEKGSTLKGKYWLPAEENSFLLQQTIF